MTYKEIFYFIIFLFYFRYTGCYFPLFNCFSSRNFNRFFSSIYSCVYIESCFSSSFKCFFKFSISFDRIIFERVCVSLFINDIVLPTRNISGFAVSVVVDHDIEWFIICCRAEFNDDVTLIDDASGAATNKEFDEAEICCSCCGLEDEEGFNGRVGDITALISLSLTHDRRWIPLPVRRTGPWYGRRQLASTKPGALLLRFKLTKIIIFKKKIFDYLFLFTLLN